MSIRSTYNKIYAFKKSSKIINLETAAYALAYEHGINIQKYLPESKLDVVQKAIYGKHGETIKSTLPTSHKVPLLQRGKEVKIGNKLLPMNISEEAKKMSRVYPIFYVFENSVRYLIQIVLEKLHGKNWWDTNIPKNIMSKAKLRMDDEGKKRWHGKRGAHPINYLDIEDLANIITNNWNDFESIFPSQHWVKGNIEIITTSRNVIAHCNPLSDADIRSSKVRFEEWSKQISNFQDHIQTSSS